MTVIGHLANAGILSGTAGLISKRATLRLIAYYLVVMAIFIAWTHYADPQNAAALYIDWTGNLGGIFFLVYYLRRGTDGERFFVAALLGSQLLAGFSHSFDLLMLKALGNIPDGMWRPQHFWHTPLFGAAYCTLVSPLVMRLVRLPWAKTLGGLCLGYAFHILADTIIYDFPIYWLWPFTDQFAWAVSRAWFPETNGAYTTFGSVLYKFGESAHNPHWGWVLYTAEVVVNVLLATLFGVIVLLRKWNLVERPVATPVPVTP